MVGEIYELKNMLLEEMAKDVSERGIERLDKEKVDMVKDLADAEKSCWEAEYYRSVAEAMKGGSGDQMGYSGASGAHVGNYAGMARDGAQRGSYGYRDSMGRYARRGYGMSRQEHIDALKMELQHADPQERERMRTEIKSMMGQM